MPTINLETSRKIFEMVGLYPTERIWLWSAKKAKNKSPSPYTLSIEDSKTNKQFSYERNLKEGKAFPAPNLGELIRVLPKIGMNKFEDPANPLSSTSMLAGRLCRLYMDTDSPEAGMIACDEYLAKLLV